MNLLVTLDSNYLLPLRVMLCSLWRNNPGQVFDIYLLHASLTGEELHGLRGYIQAGGHRLFDIRVGADCFGDAPVLMYYSKEMYFRLLAFKFLPQSLERILYLDPDILVINSIGALYQMDCGDALFAAAYHRTAPVKEINRLRLKAYQMQEYYNSGVLLMNLARQRQEIDEDEIFSFVRENRAWLILPDQDILNTLFAKRIMGIDEIKYNYDTRYYRYYRLASAGEHGMDYVMKNTAILHFCGRKKPWRERYVGEFYALYKHYEALSLRAGGFAQAFQADAGDANMENIAAAHKGYATGE